MQLEQLCPPSSVATQVGDAERRVVTEGLDGQRKGAEARQDVGVPRGAVVHGRPVELDARDCDVAVESLK